LHALLLVLVLLVLLRLVKEPAAKTARSSILERVVG